MTELLNEKVIELRDVFDEAAKVERMLSNKELAMLNARSGWPDYLYDADDRKDQEPEDRRARPTAKQIDLLERALSWLAILGMRKDKRTVVGKKIVWARANGFSYRDIAFVCGIPPKTCENWYKQDIVILAKKVYSI